MLYDICCSIVEQATKDASCPRHTMSSASGTPKVRTQSDGSTASRSYERSATEGEGWVTRTPCVCRFSPLRAKNDIYEAEKYHGTECESRIYPTMALCAIIVAALGL